MVHSGPRLDSTTTSDAISLEEYPYLACSVGHYLVNTVNNRTFTTLGVQSKGFKTELEAINYAKSLLKDNENNTKVFIYKASKLVEMTAYSIKDL